MNFKNIKINSTNDDIKIKEGNTFQIIGGEYVNKEDTLEITTNTDLTLVLTPMEIEKMEIKTDNGDANISLRKTTINSLSFLSCCGDLTSDAPINFIHFDSLTGDFTNLYDQKLNNMSNKVDSSKTSKHIRNARTHSCFNERYE